MTRSTPSNANILRAMTSLLRTGLDADVSNSLRDIVAIAEEHGEDASDLLEAAQYAVTDSMMDLAPATLHARMQRLAELVRIAFSSKAAFTGGFAG